jgi:splicing factor 3B subunit 2
VNTPIPPGARYGFNEGEWGKPPVDEYGRPLYGDVYGTEIKPYDEQVVDKGLWGKVEEESAEADEDAEEQQQGGEEEEEYREEKAPSRAVPSRVSKAAAAVYATGGSGIDSVTSGISSASSGMETPESINLRKKDGTGTETPDSIKASSAPRALYQVLEEKKATVGSGSLFGSAHTYALPTGGGMSEAEKRREEKKSKQRGQVHSFFIDILPSFIRSHPFIS